MSEASIVFGEARITTESEEETAFLAGILARMSQKRDLIALSGDLGAGKSVFARGFIRALCPNENEIPSPTFTLVQEYKSTAVGCSVFHFDWYRLKTPEEVEELGFDEIKAEGISLIEWPEKAEAYLPWERMNVRLIADGEKRSILFSAGTVYFGRKIEQMEEEWKTYETSRKKPF